MGGLIAAHLDGSVEAVLLDAGGVLLLPDADALRRGLAPFGVAPDDEACRRAHYESMREADRLGGPAWALVDRVFARVAGVAEQDIDDVIPVVDGLYTKEPWVPIPGAAEALLDLQDAGFALAIVSNAHGTMEEQLLGHRICSVEGGEVARVSVVVDSQVVGIEKPDPRIFELALAALETGPERSVYVGDTVHFDVEGARAAGLPCVHVDPYRGCTADDHGHIASITELAAHLRG